MSTHTDHETGARRLRPFGAMLGLAVMVAVPANGAAQTYDSWFNARIDDVISARFGQNSGARETEAPAIARGSTAIVNETGFSDLIGIVLGGGALTRGGDSEADGAATALTLTPYALLAGILGTDPNDPFRYEENSAWRALALTLGTETTEADDGSEVRATLLGFKLKLWSRRTIAPDNLDQLRRTLGLTTGAAGRLQRTLSDSLHAWAGAFAGFPTDSAPTINLNNRVSFLNLLTDSSRFAGTLNFIGEDRVAVLLSMIEAGIEPFLELRQAANEILAELKGEPQVALDVQGRIRESGGDELRLGLGLDIGVARRVQLTANANASFVNDIGNGTDAKGGTLAAGVSFALGPERLGAADPLSLDIALEGEFLDRQHARWNAQGKVQLPVLEGLSLPLSLTWSNRMDTTDENGLVARVGFAVDTARLLRAMGH